MSARLLAIFLVLALLPVAEVSEQVEHLVGHVLAGEDGAHSAHHDEVPEDCEHGCTGLIHICVCHRTLALAPDVVALRRGERLASEPPLPASTLRDLSAREPAFRPPIG